jgi:hypothetical protein
MDTLPAFKLFAVTAIAGLLRAARSQPLVRSGVRLGMRAGIGLWFPTRRVAFWAGRGQLDSRGAAALDSKWATEDLKTG